MNLTSIDAKFLRKALRLAQLKKGFCAPNPSVGAVLVSANKILARGFHEGYGLPHAEVNALNNLAPLSSQSTLYVTLEPCAHFGKTPPCVNLIIEKKISRVVFGYVDPNPLVCGLGRQLLEKAGIECVHLQLDAITDFYESYAHWQKVQLPTVTAKLALSMNGCIAGPHGQAVAITGSELADLTHKLRKKADALLTTAATIIKDNPRLNARIKNRIYQKPVYILDRTLQIPYSAEIFKTAKHVTIFHAETVSPAINLSNVTYHAIPLLQNNLNLNSILRQIGKDGIHDLWVEAGGKCFAAFFEGKLLKKALIYIAPKWILQGTPAFQRDILKFAEDAKIEWQSFGRDVLCDIRW
jgi:diaminohydroxyphosphoribosylaminopyrimidine deaminase/5-amino-6-(5-phosphoribosylamino)uracil reductase